MKGLTLSIFYTAKNHFSSTLVVGIIAAVVFSHFKSNDEQLSCYHFLISPITITSNVKRTQDG